MNLSFSVELERNEMASILLTKVLEEKYLPNGYDSVVTRVFALADSVDLEGLLQRQILHGGIPGEEEIEKLKQGGYSHLLKTLTDYMRFIEATEEERRIAETLVDGAVKSGYMFHPLITPNVLAYCRAAGLLAHHEIEERDGEILRDDWYVATPEWVEGYHRSGGTWGYSD